ncbi:MAG: aspartyl protease family protein [Siphonobacter sp.]
MKHALPLVLMFGLVLGLIHSTQGQEKFGFILNGRSKTTCIPFELQSNLIVVPITINHSDTLRFILDSGVSTVILTDPTLPIIKTMRPARKIKVAGVGEGDNLSATVTVGNQIQVGKVTGYNQSMVVLDQDILNISEYLGMTIHGIFGYELFNQFVTTIDFAKKEIILRNPDQYRYRKSQGQKFPITIEDAKPYLNAVAMVDKEKTVPIKVVIDTGAGHALSLDVHSKNSIQLPQKVVRAQLGRGLSGIINGSLGRIPKLRIGTLEMNNLIASFPDSIAYGMKLAQTTERQGNIGCELLRRFRVTFNYPNRYIVLKPIRRRMREAFEHNMSGMEVLARGRDFHQYVIEKVEKNSPAELAGLQPGDELVSVDGDFCGTISISDLHKVLQRGEGRELVLAVRRNHQLFITSLVLKRVI